MQRFVSGLKDAIKKSGSHVSAEKGSSSSWIGLVTREYLGGNGQRDQGFNKDNVLHVAPIVESKRSSVGQIPTIRRISSVEMQERRDKKLCYYYDESFEPRHKCQRRQIYLL